MNAVDVGTSFLSSISCQILTMNTVTLLALLTVCTILVKSKNIPNSYTPPEDLLEKIFADEKSEVKSSPRSCANNTCTIKEIYEIFGVEPIPLEIKMKPNSKDTNRVAFAGGECPTEYVKIGGSCVETD